MAYTLDNGALQLEINPETSRWSVTGQDRDAPVLENLQIGLTYTRGRIRSRILDRWMGVNADEVESVDSPIGSQHQLSLSIGLNNEDLHFILSFALPEDSPLLRWRLRIENRGSQPALLGPIDLLSAGFTARGQADSPGAIRFAGDGSKLAFYSNGWQSWSYTGVYGTRDRYRGTRMGLLRTPVIQSSGTPRLKKPGEFASEMFGVLGDRDRGRAVLVGFLSQREHFGSLSARLGGAIPALRLWANGDNARLEPGSALTTDWACLQFLNLEELDPMGPYLESVARVHGLDGTRWRAGSPTGWCSWYYFSSPDFKGDLQAADIRRNLEAMRDLRPDLPLEIAQIDDGYESQIGDWFSFTRGFPEGVAPLAEEIRQSGFTPGLWLAPYVLHPRSRLAIDHPDWILRTPSGRPANAGYLWGTFACALDLTHPEALNHTTEVIRTAAAEWGFPYLKLDFLYAAALQGRRSDPTRTGAQTLRLALNAARQAAGNDTFLLGCGCPLGPAIGLVDAMRIGADTARRWRPAYQGIELFFREETSFPAVQNAVHNSLTRTALHKRWWINDPDCLQLRPETRLSLAEVQAFATVIALTGGSLLLSDHLPDLPADRLRIAEQLLPIIDRRPVILDWFRGGTPRRVRLDLEGPVGSWKLLALFNWEDRPEDLTMSLGDFQLSEPADYYLREFWIGKTRRVSSIGTQWVVERLPAHGVALFAVRAYQPGRAAYLGSDLHISQGLEVVDWSPGLDGLTLTLQRPGHARGGVELALPLPIRDALSDGQPVPWNSLDENRYCLELEFEAVANIDVSYK
jgi:alpha-galactosidase